MLLLKTTFLRNVNSPGFFYTFKSLSTMANGGFSIRSLQVSEFKEAFKTWGAQEGRNPGLYEDLAFYAACPSGHKGLFKDNRMVAFLSAARYSRDLAYLGLYMVDPQYRRQGLGQALAESTLDEIADCALKCGNAVPSQEALYQNKYGFVRSHANHRFNGAVKPKSIIRESETSTRIVGLGDTDVGQLIEYDASVFSVPREAFLRQWIGMPRSRLLVAKRNGRICGYGVLSRCLQGHKLAPLFADDPEIAEALWSALVGNTRLQVDVPGYNQAALELARRFGLGEVSQTARMYAGKRKLVENKSVDSGKIYALTTLEIG